MRPRDERAHPVINDALDKGYLDTGAEYPIDGMNSHDSANEARKSVRLAAQHLNVSAAAWVVDQDGNPCFKACADPQAPHGIRFRIHSKDAAREHVVRQSGGDPAKLKYNPFARGQGPVVDDSGRRI